MKQDEIRHKLIDGTIHVIARDGLEKATTKQISKETAINEAYIYRCFADKDDLFATTFEFLDEELVAIAMQYIKIMYMTDMEYKLRCRFYFTAIWRFLLGNRDKCLTFIRYYYSPYFEKYSAENHKHRFLPLVEKFQEAFLNDANVWMLLNYILNVMLDFSVKVYSGVLPDDDDTSEHIFRLIYTSIEQYFNKRSAKHCEKSF